MTMLMMSISDFKTVDILYFLFFQIFILFQISLLKFLLAASPELFITKKENSYDTTSELQLDGLDPLGTPPPPAPQSRQGVGLDQQQVNVVGGGEVEAAIKDIRMALQRTKTLPVKSPSEEPPEPSVSPIWIPRYVILDC